MLKYFLIGEELVSFTDEDLSYMYLGEGSESIVYEYHDEALKLYNSCCPKLRMDEETANKLSKLYTKRILLPQRIIKNPDDGTFLGYTTKRINNCNVSGIIRMKMKDFITELNLITDDISILSNNNIDVEDFNIENTVYNGNIYLVDPGSYIIRTLPNLIRYVKSDNRDTLNNYIKNEIFGMVKLTKKEKNILDNIKDSDIYITDYIKETAKESESVRQYVKRLTR